jgi:uncharacterized phiE125 gp8 family phage protein
MTTLTTREDVRQNLQLSSTDDDDLLDSFIEQAEGYAEGFCNTPLIQKTYREFYHVRNGNSFVVQNKFIQSISSLKLNSKTINQYSLNSNTGYTFSGSTIKLIGEKFTPSDMIQIEYIAGYTSENVPKSLKRAITYIASEMYRKRDRIGLSSEQLQSGGSTSYVLTIDPHVEMILGDYKRVTTNTCIGNF